MRYHNFGDGRYAVRLDPGEEIVASVAGMAAAEGITAGHVTGLGSTDVVTLGFLDPETNDYLRRRFEERMELASLTGTISMDGDRPHVHLHAVLGPRELLGYAGHVHEAIVGAVAELFVTALPGRLERHPMPGQPFHGLFLPGEPPPAETPPNR